MISMQITKCQPKQRNPMPTNAKRIWSVLIVARCSLLMFRFFSVERANSLLVAELCSAHILRDVIIISIRNNKQMFRPCANSRRNKIGSKRLRKERMKLFFIAASSNKIVLSRARALHPSIRSDSPRARNSSIANRRWINPFANRIVCRTRATLGVGIAADAETVRSFCNHFDSLKIARTKWNAIASRRSA